MIFKIFDICYLRFKIKDIHDYGGDTLRCETLKMFRDSETKQTAIEHES